MAAKVFEPTWKHLVNGKTVNDDSSSHRFWMKASYHETEGEYDSFWNSKYPDRVLEIKFYQIALQDKECDTLFRLEKKLYFDIAKDSKITYRSFYRPNNKLLWYHEHNGYLEKEIREVIDNNADIYESDKWQCANGADSNCEHIKISYTCIRKEDSRTYYLIYYLGIKIIYEEYEIRLLTKVMPFFWRLSDDYYYETNTFIKITDTSTNETINEYEMKQVKAKDFLWQEEKLENGEYKPIKPMTIQELADLLPDESSGKKKQRKK